MKIKDRPCAYCGSKEWIYVPSNPEDQEYYECAKCGKGTILPNIKIVVTLLLPTYNIA